MLRIASKLIGILFSIALTLALIEISVRLFDLDRPSLSSWSDRPTEYYVHSDALNLQDHTHKAVKPDGVFRVAVIGDSFTFAPYMQADDTFVKRLERWWNQKSPGRFEVINYGVPGYSTSHEVKVAERAIKEQADLVILQITLNDPEIKPYTPTALDGTDRFGQPHPSGWFNDNFRTVKFISTRLANQRSVEQYRDYFFKLWNRKDSFNNFKKSLDSVVKVCRENNIPIFAVVFPLFGFPNDKNYPFHPIHEKLSGLLDKRKVPSLDLFRSFENIPLDRIVVLPGRDRHPNEIAHRIAAEAINEELIKRGLIEFFK